MLEPRPRTLSVDADPAAGGCGFTVAGDRPKLRWEIVLLIEDRAWRSTVPGAAATARRAARRALSDIGAPPGGLTLMLSDDAAVRALNCAFRGTDKATNVLSFPDAPDAGSFGDIVLARETLLGEAATQGKTPRQHLAHLVVHAILHLFGFDHECRLSAERMEWRERRILADLAVPDPYRLPGPLPKPGNGLRP